MVLGYISTFVDYVLHEDMESWPGWVWVSLIIASLLVGCILGAWGGITDIR